MPTVMQIILEEVSSEVRKQVDRWGIQGHEPPTWVTIMSEELGEVSKAALQGNKEQYRHELYQLAAAAICALYELDVADIE